jgi:hypothetical protein
LAILAGAIYNDVGKHVKEFNEDPVARMSVYVILGTTFFFLLLIAYSISRWDKLGKFKEIER